MNKFNIVLILIFFSQSILAMKQEKPAFLEQCKDLVLLSIERPSKVEDKDLEQLNLSNKKIKQFKAYVKKTVALRKFLHEEFYDVCYDSFKKEITSKFNIPLKTLNLSHNKINKLPSALAHLLSLTSLDLSHNRLTKLPSKISELTNLKKLRISHNNDLVQLPNSMTQLTQLKSLNVGVYFDGCHGMMPTDVHCCALQSLPEGLENLPKLNANSKRDLRTLKEKFVRQQQYQQIKNSPLWKEIYKTKLTDEQKDAITAKNYSENPEEGRNVIKLMTQIAFESLKKEEKAILDEHECASYLISVREAVLSDKPIRVTNIDRARARAAQRLTMEQKAALSRVNFNENRVGATIAATFFANYVVEELQNHNLLPKEFTPDEYRKKCIQDKMEELEQAYS